MTITHEHILRKLRRNIAEQARMLQEDQELLQELEAAYRNHVESEVQAQLNLQNPDPQT